MIETATHHTADAPACDPLTLESISAKLFPSHSLDSRADFAVKVAADFASKVDHEGRFPSEAMTALREQRLLGLMVPREFGGEGIAVSRVADICYRLGQACASTAMIFAMHQVKAACLVRHAAGQPAMESFMRRLAAEQLLIASSTTEGTNGGDVRSSAGAVETAGNRMTLSRDATCISYGRYADALMTTARRDSSAAKADQVLVVLHKDDYTLESTGGWDTLGMRGTVSEGFQVRVDAARAQVMDVPYSAIHVQSMVPTAHIFWGSVWAGIAAAALEKARRFVRNVSRKSGGSLPPGAVHMTRAISSLRMLRALIVQAAEKFEVRASDADALSAMDFQTEIVMLKIEASELALQIVLSAMRTAGLAAYRQDGEFSIARHLRDIMAAPIMIHNDRILSNAVLPSVAAEIPAHLTDFA